MFMGCPKANLWGYMGMKLPDQAYKGQDYGDLGIRVLGSVVIRLMI